MWPFISTKNDSTYPINDVTDFGSTVPRKTVRKSKKLFNNNR